MTRRLPQPWSVVEVPGGFKVVDANSVALAFVYARDDLSANSGGAAWLSSEEAWRIANAISKLPMLLRTKSR